MALQNVSSSITGLRDTMAGLTATYNAVQQANTQLTTVMRQRMNASDEDVKKVNEVIGAQSKLGVVGGTIQKTGAQQIATFLKEKGTLEQLIPAMNDLLAQQRGLNATQEDARSVANLMGKAMTGQTSALKRVGITFTDAQKKVMEYGTEQQRAAMLAQIITDNVGHLNAQLAKTDAGRLKQAEMRFAGIKVQIGEIVSKGLPYVTLAAQTLTIASSVVTLGKSLQGAVAVMGSLNIATKVYGAVCASAKTAMVGLSATARVAQAAFTGATVGATTLKMAIRGLMISTVVGAAIVALGVGVEALVNHLTDAGNSTKQLTAAEEEAQTARQQEMRQRAEISAAIAVNIARLKAFKGSKAEEKTLVAEMNNTYGEALGYYSSVAQWYTALVGNSKAYCDQMINEVRIRELANKAATLQQQRHDISYDENGRARKYSKRRATRLKAVGQVDAGDGKVLPRYATEEIKGTSDLEKANAKVTALYRQEQSVKKQMMGLTKQNAGITFKKYPGYRSTAPSTVPSTGRGAAGSGKTGASESGAKAEKPALEKSLDWYDQKMQELHKKIYATNNETTAQGLQAQYEDLERKSKALKVSIGLEEPDAKEVKTYVERLQDKLAAAQKELDNATTIEARVTASAKVDEIQAQIDAATKGEVSIKADVEPTYIQRGSLADKRQSYQNAQGKASRIQEDFEIGIIGKDEAERQIAEVNKEIEALGKNLKPLKLEVDNKNLDTLRSLGNIDLSNFESVEGALRGIKSMSGGTAKGLAATAAACQAAGSAMQQLGANSGVAKTGMILGAIGQIVLSYAQAMASTKDWVSWLAFGLTGASELASIIATVKGFATGGIVGGNSTTGDKVPVRVNSGEMILTKTQQARLFAMASGQLTPTITMPASVMAGTSMPRPQAPAASGKTTVRFVINGDTLVGAVSNNTRLNRKIGKHPDIVS